MEYTLKCNIVKYSKKTLNDYTILLTSKELWVCGLRQKRERPKVFINFIGSTRISILNKSVLTFFLNALFHNTYQKAANFQEEKIN